MILQPKAATNAIEFTPIDRALIAKARHVLALAERRKLGIVTAESCTGGLVAAVLSEAPGAAEWLHGGIVAYTKANKIALLGVDPGLIERHGLVSEATARAMAEGALARSPAQLSVSVTGVAGPSRDEDATPVGVVHIAATRRGGATIHVEHRFGDQGRARNRYRGVEEALALLARAAAPT